MSKSKRRSRGVPKPHNGQLSSINVGFDYASLPSSIRRQVERETLAIRGFLRRTVQNVIQIGLRLTAVHETIGRDHFQSWLSAQFRWSQATASNYMQAAARFCEAKCLEQFQASALFELARKKASDDARAEAMNRAQQGEIITKPIAQLIIRSHSKQSPRPRRTVGYHVARSLKDLAGKIALLSADETDEIHGLLSELLAAVDKARETTPRNGRVNLPR